MNNISVLLFASAREAAGGIAETTVCVETKEVRCCVMHACIHADERKRENERETEEHCVCVCVTWRKKGNTLECKT